MLFTNKQIEIIINEYSKIDFKDRLLPFGIIYIIQSNMGKILEAYLLFQSKKESLIGDENNEEKLEQLYKEQQEIKLVLINYSAIQNLLFTFQEVSFLSFMIKEG